MTWRPCGTMKWKANDHMWSASDKFNRRSQYRTNSTATNYRWKMVMSRASPCNDLVNILFVLPIHVQSFMLLCETIRTSCSVFYFGLYLGGTFALKISSWELLRLLQVAEVAQASSLTPLCVSKISKYGEKDKSNSKWNLRSTNVQQKREETCVLDRDSL